MMDVTYRHLTKGFVMTGQALATGVRTIDDLDELTWDDVEYLYLQGEITEELYDEAFTLSCYGGLAVA